MISLIKEYKKQNHNNTLSITLSNSIRRVVIDELGSFTFNNVNFSNFNSSIYNTEYIIQRLRLIPIIQENINKNSFNFHCNVDNKTDKWMKITPKNIKCDVKNINIINDDINNNLPIIYLPPNESIHFTCNLEKTSKTGYSKYCHSWFDDDKLYIESIGKCNDMNIPIIKAIDFLIDECNKIKKYILNYKDHDDLNNKFEYDFKNISRSALNIIVEMYRHIASKVIAVIKKGDFNITSDDIEKLNNPTDFIVSVLQPHITEDIYRVFINVNTTYNENFAATFLKMTNLNLTETEVKECSKIKNISNTLFLCIICTINHLNNLKNKLSTNQDTIIEFDLK